MTTFEIPTLTTERLRLRAFAAGDLDAYAAMQANPEVMRFLVDGRTHTRVEVWRIMAGFLGHWPLRGYGMWACVKADSGSLSEASASFSRWTGRNRSSPTHSTGHSGVRVSRPRQRRRHANEEVAFWIILGRYNKAAFWLSPNERKVAHERAMQRRSRVGRVAIHAECTQQNLCGATDSCPGMGKFSRSNR
jgi:RimJ/RimL family protein N-acetyltransferase